MSTPEATPRNRRETRLLLVTIAVSVGVLLLLARFRFPEAPAVRTVESAPAPLERLAARAAYDELASIMADLERRLTPRITIVRAQTAGGISAAVAPRLLPDRAVAVVNGDATIIGASPGADQEVIARDRARDLAVLRVPAIDDSAVTIRPGPPRFGPRYVAVVEATSIGPAVRPVYVGRVDTFQDPRTGATLLTLAATETRLPRGAAVFTLDGLFVGLVRESRDAAVVVPGEVLRTIAQSAAAPSAASATGDLGISVDPLAAALSRATGAETGVVVVLVTPGGPATSALQSGDVIQSIDGVQITNVEQFRDVESTRAPGAQVAIAGIRRRAPLVVTITAADAAAMTPAQPAAPDDTGLVGRTVPGVGIEVVTVAPGSSAARAGLQRGDLIVAADGQKAPSSTDLLRRFRTTEPGTGILLTVQRMSQYRVLALERR